MTNGPAPPRSPLAALAGRFGSRREQASLLRAVEQLTAHVERLTAIQQKQTEQIRRLGEMLEERGRRTDSALREGSASVDQRLKSLREMQAKTSATLRDEFNAHERTHTKWRKSVNRQLGALVRTLLLPLDNLPDRFRLHARRFQLYSQHEEDGLTLALTQEAGIGTGRFVEIGCGRNGGNAAMLAYECGWSGLMVDGSPEAIERVRRHFAINPGVVAVAAMVGPDNVNTLITEHGFAGEVDVLSLDIDSADYWVLDALTACSPKILIVEYNALFGPERAVTVPLGTIADDAPKGYLGTSLAALEALAGRKNYRLVVCDDEGSNAFFLRNDVATHVPGTTAAAAFRPFRIRTRLDDDEEKRDIFAIIRDRGLPLVDV